MAAAIDRLGDTINVSLTLFLQACPAIMFFPLAEKYMALMGWTVVQPDNGGPVQARRVQNIASSVLLAQSRNRGATINELILHLIREGMVNTVAGVANPKQSDDEEKTRFASYADVKDQKQSLDVTLLRESIEQRAELRKLKGRGKFVQ
ncbi:hypothetical protein K470DRAFT_254830 [Piedraia hortae CBS 480.64]|uniref:Uncharacterized protein n=1 Tax=Piedraia hortae CBS 480.64 TaxID=1314780 RepID=A0A6A7C7S1_9PEZI|nr:hypothetical protein K470DRAFT_254830 [Piedraia hortae CBS 480.64]